MKCSISHGRPRTWARTVKKLGGRLPVLALLVGLSAPLLAGCPGTLGGSGWPKGDGSGSGGSTGAGTGGASGTCDAETLWFKNTDVTNGCGNTACHGGSTFPPNLANPDPWSRLAGVNSTYESPCKGQAYVNTSKPADGVLIKRLNGMSCGAIMPFGGTAVNQGALDCITSWVNSKLP